MQEYNGDFIPVEAGLKPFDGDFTPIVSTAGAGRGSVNPTTQGIIAATQKASMLPDATQAYLNTGDTTSAVQPSDVNVHNMLVNAGAGLFGTLASAGAAVSDVVGAHDTAQQLDQIAQNWQGTAKENGGDTILGGASNVVGSVAPALLAGPAELIQVATNAGLFGIPAFRNTLNAEVANGTDYSVALARAVKSFGVNMVMPTAARHGGEAAGRLLGTEGMTATNKAVTETGANGIIFGAIDAASRATDKASHIANGEQDDTPWIDPAAFATSVVAGGAMHAAPLAAHVATDAAIGKINPKYQAAREMSRMLDATDLGEPTISPVAINPNLSDNTPKPSLSPLDALKAPDVDSAIKVANDAASVDLMASIRPLNKDVQLRMADDALKSPVAYDKVDSDGNPYRDFVSGGLVRDGEHSGNGYSDRLYPPKESASETGTNGRADGSVASGAPEVAGNQPATPEAVRNPVLPGRSESLAKAQADFDARRQDHLDAITDPVARAEAEKAYPTVQLNDPAPQVLGQIAKVREGVAGLLSIHPDDIAFFHDDRPGAVNGVEINGKAHINTVGLGVDATHVGLHEGHHVLERIAEVQDSVGLKNTPAQQYRDATHGIFDDLSDEGKRNYVTRFLHANELDALRQRLTSTGKGVKYINEACKAQVNRYMRSDKLKSEMAADFVGNRASDRQFLTSLKQADPKGFGTVVNKWIILLNKLMSKLRGSGSNTESKAVDSYLGDQLEKHKDNLRAALIAMKRGGSNDVDGLLAKLDSKFSAKQGVYAEVAPDPRDVAKKEAWDKLSDGDKERVTRNTMDRTFSQVAQNMGLKGWSMEYTTGMFEKGVNPSTFIKAPEGATPEQLSEVARVMGHVLDQKGMVAFDENNTDSGSQAGFVKVVLPKGLDPARINEIRLAIAKEVPQADGDTLRDGALVFGNFSEYGPDHLKVTDQQFYQAIQDAIKRIPSDEHFEVLEPKRFHSGYIQAYWGNDYVANGSKDYLEGTRYGTRNDQTTSSGGDDLRGRSGSDSAWVEKARDYASGLTDKFVQHYTRTPTRERDGIEQSRLVAEAPSYGNPRDGSLALTGYHFSKQARDSLNSAFYGAGLKGLERDRLSRPENSDIRPRSFFYVDTGKGVTPEASVGSVRHVVNLRNIYDASNDPMGLIKNAHGTDAADRMSKWERAIKDAGFDGYLNRNEGGNQGYVALVGKHVIDTSKARFSLKQDFDNYDVDFSNFDLDSMNDDIGKPDDKKDEEPLDKDALHAELEAAQAKEQQMRDSLVARARAKQASAVPKVVTKQDMEAGGLHPESAFNTSIGDAVEKGDHISFSNENPYQQSMLGSPYRIDKALAGGWTTRAGGSWSIKPMDKDTAIKFAKNMLVARKIQDSGFDIASAYRKGTVFKLVSAWQKLAEKPGMFKIPDAGTSKDFPTLAAEMKAMPAYDVTQRKEGLYFTLFEFTRKSDGVKFGASISLENGDKITACTMGLNGSGDLGSKFYAVAGEYARLNGKRFMADSSLSSINTARRTEQALSYALKTGNSGIMLPGIQNRVYGYQISPKTAEDHIMNTGRLLLASLRNAVEIDPNIRRLNYDPATDTFTDAKGRDASAKVLDFLALPEARAFGMGRTTLARAVITSNLLSGKMDADAVKAFTSPIAYSLKQVGDEHPMSEAYGDPAGEDGKVALNPGFDEFMRDSKIKDADGNPTLMYHGTAQDITAFRPKQAGAIFLSPRANFAEDFAYGSADWMADHYKDVLSPEQIQTAKDAATKELLADKSRKMSDRKMLADQIKGDYAQGEAKDAFMAHLKDQMPSGPNILPVVVHAESPFDYKNQQHRDELIEQMFANAKDGTGGTIRMWGDGSEGLLFSGRSSMSSTRGMLEEGFKDGNWSLIEEPETQQALHDLGHDSFWVEEGGQRNLAVYDPGQIKSAIGNNGDYDISNPDIRFAKKQGPDEAKYQHNYLVPEIDGFKDGSIAHLPALAFQKDGIMRQFPSMPVRIRVGEHQTGDKLSPQYGLQHRIENQQDAPSQRGYLTPKLEGDGTQAEVERAARDITLGVLNSKTAYADSSPSKIYLHAPDHDRMTVLKVDTDANGQKFWSVITSIPANRERMNRSYKAPTSVFGLTVNGERTQQALDTQRGILKQLQEPGRPQVSSESYILDEDNKLFNQPVVNSSTVSVAKKEPGTVVKSATGRLSLKRPSPPDFSLKQLPGFKQLDHASTLLSELIDQGLSKSEVYDKIAPMSDGTQATRSLAQNWINSTRKATYEWDQIDQYLTKTFDAASRKRMWDAADEENDLRRQGIVDLNKGLNRLDPVERTAVEHLHEYSKELWQRAKDVGLVKGDGLAFWTPRMMVTIGADGDFVAPTAGRQADSSGKGRNFTTSASSAKHRQYELSSDTEAAMQAKGGELARDIRTMPLAMGKMEKAISGRELVNQIKALGRATGTATTSPGAAPGFFTLDHPSFQTWKPRLERVNGRWETIKDQAGNVIMDKTPIYISNDFKGPLKAVLSESSSAIYNGYMLLKSKAMSAIMYSPLIHGQVIAGRAFAYAKLKLPVLYFTGNAAKHDVEFMKDMIGHGMVPIGNHSSMLDVGDIVRGKGKEGGWLDPNESWVSLGAKAIGNAVGKPFGVKPGDGIKTGLDKAGDFWHNTLLWDRVGDLQAGIAKDVYTKLIAKGADDNTAFTVAAHIANRYSGAIGRENMSDTMHKFLNVLLFSKSFNMGNIGTIKDVLYGMPAGLKAQMKEGSSADSAEMGETFSKRKAFSGLVADLAATILVTSVVQDWWKRNKDAGWREQLTEGLTGYQKRMADAYTNAKDHPFDLSSYDPYRLSSTVGNEPGKESRVDMGEQAGGRHEYMRLPTGKVVEDLLGWTMHPVETLAKKLSPMASAVKGLAQNDKNGFGTPIYNPSDSVVHKAMDVAKYLVGKNAPVDQVQTINDIHNGKGTQLDKDKLEGNVTGLTVSQGHPGGPEAAVAQQVTDRISASKKYVMEAVKRDMKYDDEDKARERLSAIGLTPHEVSLVIRHLQNPKTGMSKSVRKGFNQHANDEERAAMGQLGQ